MLYDWYSIKNDSVFLKVKGKKKKIRINANEVIGYYSLDKNRFYYLKKVKEDSLSKAKYGFYFRELEGEIKIYVDHHSSSDEMLNGTTGTITANISSVYTWFAENEDNFVEIFSNGRVIRFGRRKGKENFKSLFTKDDKVYDSIFEEERYNLKNIFKVVSDYNLKHHIDSPFENGKVKKLILFRDKENSNASKVLIEFRNKELQLGPNEKVELEIPTNSDTKVCLTFEDKYECFLLRSSPYFDKCYEVKPTKADDIRIQNKNSNSRYLKVRFRNFDKKKSKKSE
ncbi:hypothetical protein [Winogradskyella sp. 3972H.M.0a.05]|uniref:hypothetical protein n=1 Tax=Winogradskyella sp. 3972H.M.0a.05 TaxID=2950277 RepID=UPI003392E6D2